MAKIAENKADFLRLVEMIAIGKSMTDARKRIDSAEMVFLDLLELINSSRAQMFRLQTEIKGIRERLAHQGNSVARQMTQLAIEVSFIVSLSEKAFTRALPIAEQVAEKIQRKTGWGDA